mmetsp:Transcript_38939/g.85593  ORF Transcript_38939/g.85593 Transcript_38939/m.85593 type:complete len:265 (-) Transcript_38939:925-1719(-)
MRMLPSRASASCTLLLLAAERLRGSLLSMPRRDSVADWRASSRNCSCMYLFAILTLFSTKPMERSTIPLRPDPSAMPEPRLRLAVPVYCTETTLPVSLQSRCSASCNAFSTPVPPPASIERRSTGETPATWSALSCSPATRSPMAACTMLVRLRQSRQLVRTTPRCSSGAMAPTLLRRVKPCAARCGASCPSTARIASIRDVDFVCACRSNATNRSASGLVCAASRSTVASAVFSACARSVSSPRCSRRLRISVGPYCCKCLSR